MTRACLWKSVNIPGFHTLSFFATDRNYGSSPRSNPIERKPLGASGFSVTEVSPCAGSGRP